MPRSLIFSYFKAGLFRNKYRTEDIIQYFLKYATGRQITDFENMMKILLEGKEFSEHEKLELLKSKLGPESLLREGSL